jgi:hypothetical protein
MVKYLPLNGQGEESFAKYIPGVEKGGPSPHMQPGGRRASFSWGALVGFLMLFVLLGFIFLLFGPVEAMQGGMGMVGLNFICPSDPSMGDGPVMPTNLGDQEPDGGDLTGVPDGSSNGMLNFTLGFLNFANGLRMGLGGESFLPPGPCMNPLASPPPAPDADDSAGGSTGGAAGGGSGNPPDAPSTGGEQAGSPGDATEVCANNGGVQWQGQSCVCPGLIDNITLCADGSKIDAVTQQTCTPDQSCDQPSDPGNPPACPCARVCTQPSATAPDQCAQWEYRDCTGNICRP